jgi:hypothetical protein
MKTWTVDFLLQCMLSTRVLVVQYSASRSPIIPDRLLGRIVWGWFFQFFGKVRQTNMVEETMKLFVVQLCYWRRWWATSGSFDFFFVLRKLWLFLKFPVICCVASSSAMPEFHAFDAFYRARVPGSYFVTHISNFYFF